MSVSIPSAGYTYVFSLNPLSINQTSRSLFGSTYLGSQHNLLLETEDQNLDEKIKNMNLCDILLDYFEAARLRKKLACRRDNPWQIDDQAMRRLHIGSHKRGPCMRYFANSGITCIKPKKAQRISKSLYGTEYQVEKDEDIPFGAVTMASHTPHMIFPSHKKKIEEAKAIVSMASHMVPAIFNRKEDPMKYIESHLIANKMTPDDIEDNLSVLFDELSSIENLSEEDLLKQLRLAAKRMIYDLIERASAHYENHMKELSADQFSKQENNNSEIMNVQVSNPDFNYNSEMSFLSRESTQLSEDRIQRIAEELVLSVTEQASHSIENKVLFEINSSKILPEGQVVSS